MRSNSSETMLRVGNSCGMLYRIHSRDYNCFMTSAQEVMSSNACIQLQISSYSWYIASYKSSWHYVYCVRGKPVGIIIFLFV